MIDSFLSVEDCARFCAEIENVMCVAYRWWENQGRNIEKKRISNARKWRIRWKKDAERGERAKSNGTNDNWKCAREKKKVIPESRASSTREIEKSER